METQVPTLQERSVAKWGAAAAAGFQPVPDVLLVKQRMLDLDPVDVLIILNITSYWWYAEKLPFARTNTIAERMGVSARTVQRSLRKLETKGYISRVDIRTPNGDFVPGFDPSGLAAKLTALARADVTLNSKIGAYAKSKGLQPEELP